MTMSPTLVFMTALALVASAAAAQTIKPGLWESTSKVGGNPELDKMMAKMQKQMAGMPPEQRKQMESAMGGVQMGAGGMTVKSCVTQEMIDRGLLQHEQQGSCKTTLGNKSATGMTLDFRCTDPDSSGQAVYTFQGDKAYTMRMNITSNAKGEPGMTTMDSSGKWMGSDCGAIKPIAVPAR